MARKKKFSPIEIVFLCTLISLVPFFDMAVPSSISDKTVRYLLVILLASWLASFMTAGGVWAFENRVRIMANRTFINLTGIVAAFEIFWMLLYLSAIVRYHPGIGWMYEYKPRSFVAILLISIASGLLTKAVLKMGARPERPKIESG